MPIFILMFGYTGVSLAAFIISFTGVIPIVIMKKYVHFPVFFSLYKPVISTIIMIIPSLLLLQFKQNLPIVMISLLINGTVYGLVVWFWMKKEIGPYLPQFMRKRL